MIPSVRGHLCSYLYQACRERYQASSKKDRMLLAVACQMKYVQAKVWTIVVSICDVKLKYLDYLCANTCYAKAAKIVSKSSNLIVLLAVSQVPQQVNIYDCGLDVLHYVEVFLLESKSPHFSLASSKEGQHFTSRHFGQEVSGKRVVIQNLIFELSMQERAARPMDIQPKAQPKPSKVQYKINKKWNKLETSVLLNRMVERGRIRKGTGGGTHWGQISEDIHSKLGTIRSEGECRRRYDTLLKAYKKIKKIGKPFCDITDAERREANLATPLIEEWYKAIDTVCLKGVSDNAKSQKRAKLNPSDGNGMLSSSPCNPGAPPPIPSGCSEAEKPSRKQVVSSGSPGHFYISAYFDMYFYAKTTLV